ncbi:hypothetical protein B5S43_13205 [Gilliamella apicola]|uniref:Uncharacterized protein n=1 Tax=Gilliamella apicola TaxID=1196095 RepID=A0A556S8E7_9GAMM|nr:MULTISPECIES: hypothetical protein [Gilliamella]KES17570.1 Protein of unknown function (DUF2862) [Gilliamella apicola SCGC AB-598-B02]MBI0096210.1 hypothetical protein [Gilliamella sp. W8136]OTP87659.1 hypothetical protein B5S43_13205 [Gilliamella apicola]OTQ24090.1 hypothetical protein B6D22_04405 [Gilliamella apicola]TSJ97417.1 hypothetical protein FPQ15_12000 [Gilliamella apicola]
MIEPLSNIILKALPRNKKGVIGAQVEVDGVCFHDKLEVCDLKAAYLYNNRYLLLFVIDIDMGLYDEELYIYLLDSQSKKIVDHVIIGGQHGWLTPSIFKVGDIKILNDNSISFKFMFPNGSDGWIIKLFSKPIKSLPWALKYSPLVTCPVSFKRYFQIYPNTLVKENRKQDK